jgi:hypothetical protein|tara:strand:+ start:42 stop:410 length:369 start_codon:yes stop_codon:yes gene_type:complete
MSVQTKALIKRWQEFRGVAIAEACIQYHERMIEGWKETLDQEMYSLEHDDYYEEDGEFVRAIDVLRELEEDSRGQWSGADYHNYVTKEDFRQAMIRDLNVMCSIWEFADDMENAEIEEEEEE